jgi:hypothetical protein
MSDVDKEALKRRLNRGLSDFGGLEYTKRGILNSSTISDTTRIQSFLDDWQAKGYLTIIRPLENASYGDICVRLKTYIEESPFSEPGKYDPPKQIK